MAMALSPSLHIMIHTDKVSIRQPSLATWRTSQELGGDRCSTQRRCCTIGARSAQNVGFISRGEVGEAWRLAALGKQRCSNMLRVRADIEGVL